MSILTGNKLSRLAMTLFLALFIGAGLAACGDDAEDTENNDHADNGVLVSADGHFKAELHAMPDPPVTGVNMVHLKLMDAQDEPVTGATIEVEPFMPGHGHGTPEVPTFVEDGDGMYSISNIKYTMPGDWELRIDITSGETQDRIVAEYDVR